jgi:hypothetical protein
MTVSPSDQVSKDDPVPNGQFSINLNLDPSRTAAAYRDSGDQYADHGIQNIPREIVRSNGRRIHYPGWGTWRMRLDPKRGETYGGSNFYLHNSHKGFTHGCIESCSILLDDILKYRAKGNPSIDVIVRYTAPKTRGRTKW